ncbi:MAG: Gfo/Idh/MocA family oxidoreductase [Alphaproteobacteria bacterium]|nr:Gfo/Idh/MocA family oxidoreductase [Alphaproteobacteria bacterium]
MKRVITYGTFDLLHEGHLNILKRAKALGDYLIVGVTSEQYDFERGKLNVQESVVQRIENVKKTGLADQIIVEERMGQKIEDIQKYDIDTFVIGSDWNNKFDYLKEYCDVVYLPRTPGVSSTTMRAQNKGIVRCGLIGCGRIARRFVAESKYVSGLEVSAVYGIYEEELKKFKEDLEIANTYTDLEEFYKNVDMVYIATPHVLHYSYAKNSLMHGKHVLCEKPLTLSSKEAKELCELAKEKKCILFEAIKTAYCPGFQTLIAAVKSGVIGSVKEISATFTKLVTDKSLREYNPELGGGAFNELASYPLIGIVKLLGHDYKNIAFTTCLDKETGVDIFTIAHLTYKNCLATCRVGMGVKHEGEMIIAGTKGYIYVPAPWWKTSYFEARFENQNSTIKYYNSFEGDGLRYEIADFLHAIYTGHKTHKLSDADSVAIANVFERFKESLKNDTATILD